MAVPLRRSARVIDGTRSKYFIKKEAERSVKKQVNEEVSVKKEVKNEDEDDILIPPRDGVVKKESKEEGEEDVKIPPKKKVKLSEGESGKPIPKNFYPIYEQVKKMRSLIVAPVDTMGCAEIPITLNKDIPLSPRNYRFQLLVSLMLSSQTKDEVNYKAMANMKRYFLANGFNDGITIESMKWIDEKKLDQLIFSVGFHTRKASYIKKSVDILLSKWDGEVPNTLEGLVSLPGVGPKMAFLTLQKAWDLNLGIGVDVHVDRLSKMWHWVKNKKGPEETRVELESWLPRDLWTEINPELVGFGQSICLPRGRRCDLCTLSKLKLCGNVDRALIKKVETMSDDKLQEMNSKLRFDPTPLMDIEDL